MRFEALSSIGHDAYQMTRWTNQIFRENNAIQCKKLIISGGISSFLDGYYFIKLSEIPAVYGQASAFLTSAKKGYEELRNYIQGQLDGLNLASSFLEINHSFDLHG